MTDDRSKATPPAGSGSPIEARQEFGRRLKEARERAGYTVDELAYATKIMAHFIVGLEEGDFAKLPGDVFVRGFVKSICKTLDEDANDLLALVDQSNEAKRDRLLVVPGSPGADRVRIGSERPERRMNFDFVKDLKPYVINKKVGMGAAAVAGVILVGVIIVSLVSLVRNTSESVSNNKVAVTKDVETHVAEPQAPASTEATVENEQEEISQTTPPTTPELNTAATTPAPPPPATPEKAPTEPTEVVTATAIPSEQVLEIKVKESVNIRINVDKRGWETARYEPDTYTIKFKDDVNLLVLDAGAVDINFNGKSIGSLGSKGRVRRLSFVARPDAGAPTTKKNF